MYCIVFIYLTVFYTSAYVINLIAKGNIRALSPNGEHCILLRLLYTN